MSEPTATLLGYEAISTHQERLTWWVISGSMLDVVIDPCPRRPLPEAVASIGGAPISEVDVQPRQGRKRRIRIRLGVAPQGCIGDLRVRLGGTQWRWPLRFTIGLRESDAYLWKLQAPDPSRDELRARLSTAEGVELMWGRFVLGQLSRQAGDWPAMFTAWSEASALALDLGVPTWATRCLRASAQIALEQGQFSRARRLLTAVRAQQPPSDIAGHLRADYVEGLLLNAEGNPAAGALVLSDVVDRARYWLMPDSLVDELQRTLTAVLGDRVGVDADARPDEWTTATPEQLVNHAWRLIVRAYTESCAEAIVEAEKLLHAVVEVIQAEGNPEIVARTLLNLGWCAWLRSDPEDARGWHDRAREASTSSSAHSPSQLEGLLLEGTLLMAVERPLDALSAFARCSARAQAAKSRTSGPHGSRLVCAAEHGRGRALASLGRWDEALAAYRRASTEVDMLLVRLGVGQTSAFFGERSPTFDPVALSDDLADALRATGRQAAVFAERDAANARCRGHLRDMGAAATLDATGRAKVAELDATLCSMQDEMATLYNARGLSDEDRQAALDALSREYRRTWERRRLASGTPLETLRGVEVDTVSEALPSDEGLLLVWRHASSGEERWWVNASGASCVSGDLTSAELSTHTAGLAHLYVIASPCTDAWRSLSGAQRADEQPLATALSLSFLPSASECLRSWPEASNPPVVIVDTRNDLLAAETDGEWLASTLDARLLQGSAADAVTVRDVMRGATLLHFSGHGEPVACLRDCAALKLAHGALLRPEDLVTGGAAPVQVVLNGCDTGRGFADNALSLPAAFLAAGAMQVLVTTRPVPDEHASAFIRALYTYGGAADLAEGLRLASYDAWSAGLDIWTAYRLVGRRRPSGASPAEPSR